MTVFSIFIGLIGLGIMVFIHELGHFIAAKANGVAVEVFSLGWGPRLVGFRRGGTVYQISWFPIGGYCKMRGEITPGIAGGSDGQPDAKEGATSAQAQGGSFNAAPPWRRIAISVAGPVFNLVFAAIIFSIIWWVGFNIYSPGNRIVLATDYSLESSSQTPPATRAGLRTGDRILAIDGAPVEKYQDLVEKVSVAPGQRLLFTVARNEGGVTRRLDIPVTPQLDKDTGVGRIGVVPWLDPVVANVFPGTAAAIAGLEPGDRILKANGMPVTNSWDLFRVLSSKPDKAAIEVGRGGAVDAFALVPKYGASRVGFDFAESVLGVSFAIKSYHSPVLGVPGALEHGLADTWDAASLTVKGFGLLFQGINLRRAVAGPLKIIDYIGSAAVEGGVLAFFRFLAFLSVVLFLMNLLPIPAMDGGQILLFLIEIVRGRAVPANLFWRIQVIGFSILLALIVVVTFNDILSFAGR